MKRIIIVVGTRPEAIKLIPVFKALKLCAWCSPKLILTGQHREMTLSVLDAFGLKADIDLDVMQPGQTLLDISARLPGLLAEMIVRERPDAILVQGDTTSAMIAAWLGFYASCPVGHVEAGLRTGDLMAPFPEEFNRRVITLATTWHFAPTETAAMRLRAEGIDRNVFVVGNTVIDAAYTMVEKRTAGMKELQQRLPFLGQVGRRTVLVTTHRRENHGAPMREIAAAVVQLAKSHRDIDFVVPLHPNPACSNILKPALGSGENVHQVQPLEYDQLVYLLQRCFLVLTDSGGLQEEAPAFNVPVLVLREKTERPEGVAAGCSEIVGTQTEAIVNAVEQLISQSKRHEAMAAATNPYGDGHSAARIADILAAGLGC